MSALTTTLIYILIFSLLVTLSYEFSLRSYMYDGVAEPSLVEFQEMVNQTRKWVEDRQCENQKEHDDFMKVRSPGSLLSQFGMGTVGMMDISTIAKVYENVSHIYGRDLVKRQAGVFNRLCAAAGVTRTVKDCPKSSRFRTFDGSCNNPLHVNWGKAFLPLRRLLPADYSDGIAEPRVAKDGGPLPSPRDISDHVFHFEHIFEKGYNMLNSHFGQFLDHDIGHSPTEKAKCKCQRTDVCMPIPIKPGDTFFTKPCIPFIRSLPVPDRDCSAVPRQQQNQISSYIDASCVYGSTTTTVNELRDKKSGKGLLRVTMMPGSLIPLPHLPPDDQVADCWVSRGVEHCGMSGDRRTAEQPGLTAIHTIFHRCHNRLALELSKINPDWDDERLFQEVRRIMGAILQHISFNEYLPILLGKQTMRHFGLKPRPQGRFTGYDTELDASVTNVFSTSAMRFGHSQVDPELFRVNRRYEEEFERVQLAAAFFNGSVVFEDSRGGVDALVLGMLVQDLPQVDAYVSIHITRHLFNDPPFSEGLDLAAINLQRGRDNGIPSYNKWRELCGLRKLNSFEDLATEFKEKTIAKFRKLYRHVDDIDSFIAFITEVPLSDALVGPTLSCLLGKQFHDLKYGDRFWYENGQGEQVFTTDQLQEIRKVTMARMICDNLGGVLSVPSYAFKQPDINSAPSDEKSFYRYSQFNEFPNERKQMKGFANILISCDDSETIPKIDLRKWKDGV